ncbi:HypC/HybG/HupF family hydrogenase formation chaperone [Oleiharenicola sp. Vm1]|uniref:HypC/HybG/HupF family hydrogenase formation chaperone n=1 Tax=Oleiharenicola sp. Vm1 TaxID=3398393 RepID=UPI0039F57EE6
MCLAVPGKVVEILGDDPLLRSAKVSFSGVIKQVSLTCTPEAKLGDYVLVHVGVAISTVDPEEAAQTFEYLKQMGELDGIELPASPEVGGVVPNAPGPLGTTAPTANPSSASSLSTP